MRLPRRRTAVLASVATAALIVAGVITAVAAQAAVGCRVSYQVTNQWQGGFGANVTLTNTGDPLTSWSLSWSFSAGQTVTSGWNAAFTQSGSQVTAASLPYNGSVATGASVGIGFNGSWTGSNPAPSSFTVNGVTCNGGSAPTTAATRTTAPATTAPATTAPTTAGPAASCNGGSYNAEAVLSGSTWTARNGSRTVYTGTDMRSAVQAAVNSLTSGRRSKERVVVQGSGSMSAASSIDLPSYTILDVCGTINVTGSVGTDQAPVRIRNATDVEVQHLTLTGGVYFGIFSRSSNNVTLGQIDMRFSGGGLGVRIDNYSNKSVWSRNIRIDNVYQSGGGSHAVETYGVDGITIGTVTARNTGECGLLLNQTINATVGTVDADGAGTGTGYAAFRLANRAGYVNGGWATNIRVGTVKARGGGRGIFCVSESGGATIDRIDIANTGNNSILLENCHNMTIAAQSGTVSGGGDVRIAARTEFAPSSDIHLQNLTVSNTNITWSPCTGTNNTISNVTRNNSTLTWC